MDRMQFIVSVRCRIILTSFLILIFVLTGYQSHPNDIFGQIIQPFLDEIHAKVFPVIALYWLLGALINRYIYGEDF